MKRTTLPLSFALGCMACGLWPFKPAHLVSANDLRTDAPRGVVAELDHVAFDGRELRGRLLLGATVEPVTIYSDLLEWADVELKDIRDCETGKALIYGVADPWILMKEPDISSFDLISGTAMISDSCCFQPNIRHRQSQAVSMRPS